VGGGVEILDNYLITSYFDYFSYAQAVRLGPDKRPYDKWRLCVEGFFGKKSAHFTAKHSEIPGKPSVRRLTWRHKFKPGVSACPHNSDDLKLEIQRQG
jgi:hypothetical protein